MNIIWYRRLNTDSPNASPSMFYYDQMAHPMNYSVALLQLGLGKKKSNYWHVANKIILCSFSLLFNLFQHLSVNQFGCLVIFGWRYLNLSLVNVPRLLKRTTVNIPGARNRPNLTVLHLTFASWVIEFIICDVEQRKCDFMHDWISFSCTWHIFFLQSIGDKILFS